jgi:signal transduction histidine kinase/DNA-binding LacI/PurR family transcriptional regulator/AraC-like DNA-binding protein
MKVINYKSNKKPITLALLTTGAIDPNNQAIWAGVDAAASDSGVNLICYPGRLVKSPIEFEAQRNVIYRMLDAQSIDGLVVMGGINAWLNLEETYEFLQEFAPRPIATTGIVLEGIPGVSVDNYHGMYQVVTHMATTHNCRRIAFIRGQAGHQEAIDRYQAYLDVLDEYNIPFASELVYQGNFKESGGIQAAKAFLDERRVQFDALVAASDNMAIGAMKTFQERGLHIPLDVAIAGVNDEEQGLVVNPPLTTAPLHFFEQGYQAALMVLSQINGDKVPSKVVLPTQMVVRQSCGCPDPLVTHAKATPRMEKIDSFTEEILQLNSLVFGGADSRLQISVNYPVQEVFPTLLRSFLDECRGNTEGKFLRLFVETLQKTTKSNNDFPRWHEIISLLRQFTISELLDHQSRLKMENLVHQARVIIGESARRYNAYQDLQADEKLHNLGEISQSLNVVNSIEELTDVLERSLLLLNISHCYLFIYEDPFETEKLARFIFSYECHQRVFFNLHGEVFPARQLLPDSLLKTSHQHSFVVEPLYFREDQLGYAIFGSDPREEAIYEILGGQISASLKRTILNKRNIRLFNEAVEARKAAEEADKMKSSFLSTVSHELRTPLSLIVGTIEMLLREDSDNSTPVPDRYRYDLDNIRSSAQHLNRLISDVLDLASSQAGQIRLFRERLHMNDVLSEVIALGEMMTREKGLAWQADIPDNLPLVWGDRTRLRQVALNLISNAVKFTQSGTIRLWAEVGRKQLIIAVSDTGIGIPTEDQETIFDEFSRSERTTKQGIGGMGLGLAISRRLVELHGGKIGVLSSDTEGSGSTVFFSLPIMARHVSEISSSEESSKTILVLTEKDTEYNIVYNHLIKRGYEVALIKVDSSTNWLAQIIISLPGAVILDYEPESDRGWELMRTLRENLPSQKIPVIFYNLSNDLKQGSILELDYLTKPISAPVLARTLARQGLKPDECTEDQAILVVDDDPGILDLHTRMLSKLAPHCHIIKAHNGSEALEIMKKRRPDLVLLDLMMPIMDGFDVLQAMRYQETTRNIPVIVLTAKLLTEYDMVRLQQGVSAVLSKGLFTSDEIFKQIEDVLSRNKNLATETQKVVRKTMAYIHEHYPESLSRAELAGRVGFSDRYLTQCFRQETGLTPNKYLNRYRIRQARTLLEQGELNITEIALAVGFSDSNYFTRVFRIEVGMTPSDYLKGELPADS